MKYLKFIFIFTSGLYCTSSHAGFKADIAYTRLKTELTAQGITLPDGSGVPVLLAEACSNSVDDDNDPETPEICLAWLPTLSNNQFQGKTLNDKSQSTSGLFSGHATGSARLFFGNTASVAQGIDTIDLYWADHWLEDGYLNTGISGLLPKISSNRVASHSWVATAGKNQEERLFNSEVLRRVDWLIDRDEFIQSVSLTNGGKNPPVLASSFNAIAVGRSDARHGQRFTALDATYNVGRVRPDLVAPLSATSGATPVVASVAAFLVGIGHDDIALSTDPQKLVTTNRAGDAIYNAERSEVIKAILMAGADRSVSANNIIDYRSSEATQTNNGLDSRFGAGQVNVANSYQIMVAGEQNSAEDSQSQDGAINPTGFDYDPVFGGAAASNTEASYLFSTESDVESIYITLAWNIKIKQGQTGEFDGTAHLYDLNLKLFDVTKTPVLIATSSSDDQNTENLWVGLDSHRDYMIKVVSNTNQADFKWDYAIAWRTEADADHDGVADIRDNCTLVANADQIDSDGDGFGNRCDADLDNSGIVSFGDLALFRARFDSNDLNADFDGSGRVSFADLEIFRRLFAQAPGPAGELE